jgi:hypothetical protein
MCSCALLLLLLLLLLLIVLQVVAGAPGSRLIDLVVPPQALVQQDSSRAALRLHGNYYITKQVGRCTAAGTQHSRMAGAA